MKKYIIIVFIFIAVGIIWGLFLSVPSEDAALKEPIKIAMNVWPGYAHAFIAQEKGFLKRMALRWN